jgi:hypothetical protein
MKFLDYVIEWWLRQCPHEGHHVAADILEGERTPPVAYCRRCGAVRVHSEWRRPRPLWFGARRTAGCANKLGNLRLI